MSRSGYIDGDGDTEQMFAVYGWNANVRRCIAGRHGQAFMWELYNALEALPTHELITSGLVDQNGACCSLGAVARYRRMEIPERLRVTEEGEPDDYEFQEAMGPLLGIKNMLAREVMFYNDDADEWHEVPGPATWRGGALSRAETPAERWQRMRAWVVSNLRDIP